VQQDATIQYYRYWNTENSHAVHEVPLCYLKVGIGVLYETGAQRIHGTMFFHETINSKCKTNSAALLRLSGLRKTVCTFYVK
jgi:hypothetical protein